MTLTMDAWQSELRSLECGPDPLLTDLARELKELADSAEHERRRRHWADLLALRPVRAAVNLYFYPSVWERELAGDVFHYQGGLKRQIEVDLRYRLWKARHIADDSPLMPWLMVPCARPPRELFPWGVELGMDKHDELGSYRVIAPIHEEQDLDRLTLPRYEEEREASRHVAEAVRSWTGDQLTIVPNSDELHWGPFEYVVRLRGMEQILYDVYLNPGLLHRMMRTVTDGLLQYQLQREAAGAVDARNTFFGHAQYSEIPAGLEHQLKGCWAYLHAQSSGTMSPQMYEDFVQPYNEELARLLGFVYYHGCEDLSQKCQIIKRLPNLRLFHISPWTPVVPIIEQLGKAFAYEVHSHPTNVIQTFTPAQIREELRRRHQEADGANHTLILCDIETVAGRMDKILTWVEAARETAQM